MNFSADTFNMALKVFQEFGPQRRIPRDERLKAEFPSLSEAEIADLIGSFRKVEEDALEFAERVRDGVVPAAVALEMLKARHPILSEDLAGSTFNQAVYFAHK